MSSNQQQHPHFLNNNGHRHVYDITPCGTLVPSKGPAASSSFLTTPPPLPRLTAKPNSLNNSSKGSKLHSSSSSSSISSSSRPINNGNSAKSSQSQSQSPSSLPAKVNRPENAELTMTMNRPKPANNCLFKVNDDVFYLSDDGKQHFGSVLKVSIDSRSCKLFFGDGNTTWAPFDRLEKFADADEESPPPVQVQPKKSDSPGVVNIISNSKGPSGLITATGANVNNILKNLPGKSTTTTTTTTTTTPSQNTNSSSTSSTNNSLVIRKSKSNNTKTSTTRRKHELTDIVCVNCGKIEPLRNVDSIQLDIFTCFDCFKPISKRNKSVSPTKPRKSNTLSLSSTSTMDSKIKLESKNNKLNINKEVSRKSLGHDGLMNNKSSAVLPNSLTIAQKNELCFHCRQATTSFNRVHCNLCHRPCHLLCLQLNPPPFDGDKFWDIICNHCGLQISSEADKKTENKIYSARRKIQSWSDVIVLLINCLTARDQGNEVLKLHSSSSSGQKEPKYFDLDKDILPFLNNNYTRFHLPRNYQLVAIDKRKETLLNAFKSTIFQNGKEYKKKGSLWGIRNVQNGLKDNHNHTKNNTQVLKVVKEKKQMEVVPKMKIKISPHSSASSTTIQLEKSPIVRTNANTNSSTSSTTTTITTPNKSPIVHPNAKSLLAKVGITNTARIAGNKIILEQPKNSHHQTQTQKISEKIKMPSTTSSNLLPSDLSEIATILEGKNQKKSHENESSSSSQLAPTPALIISISSSSTTTVTTTTKDNTSNKPKKLLTFSSVSDFSKTTVQKSNLSLSNKRKRNVIRYNKSSSDSDTSNDEDQDNNNNKKKGKALLGDISKSDKEQFKGSSKKKHSKYKINPIKSPSKVVKTSIISPTKTKLPIRKIGRPKTKVVVNNSDILTSISTVSTSTNGVQYQQQLQVSDQITSTTTTSNVQVVPSPTKKKKKKVLANVVSGGLKRRGRPCLKPGAKKSYLDIDFSTQTNGLIPTITLNEEDNPDNLEVPHHYHQHSNVVGVGVGKKEAFNPCRKNLYENALFGYSKISCLPKEPKKPQDKTKSNLDMINLLLGERQREEDQFKLWSRAHLDLQRAKFNQINHSMTADDVSQFNYLTMYANAPKLRDLNDVDSYEIIASRVDEDGITRYLVKWKDGSVSESDSDENNVQDNKVDELMEVDQPEPEVDKQEVVVKAVETTEAEKIQIPVPGSTDHDKSLRNVNVVVPNGILSTCGENTVSVQIPSTSTSTSNSSQDTTNINLNNVNQVKINSVSSSSSNGALPPTTTTTITSTAAEVLSEIPKKAIINVQKTPTKDIIPTPAIAIKIEKRDDDDDSNSDIIVIEPKRRCGRKHVPFVDLTTDSP